jgi:hypothetical protein
MASVSWPNSPGGIPKIEETPLGSRTQGAPAKATGARVYETLCGECAGAQRAVLAVGSAATRALAASGRGWLAKKASVRRSLSLLILGSNSVPHEHRRRPVPADLHGNRLRHTRPHHVSDRRASEIMEELGRHLLHRLGVNSCDAGEPGRESRGYRVGLQMAFRRGKALARALHAGPLGR